MINESTCIIIICTVLLVTWVYWKVTKNIEQFSNSTSTSELNYVLSIAPYSLKEGDVDTDSGALLYISSEGGNNRLKRPFKLILSPTPESELVGDLTITDKEIDYNGEKATMRYIKSRNSFITITSEDEKKPQITFSKGDARGSEGAGKTAVKHGLKYTVNYKESPAGEIEQINGGYKIQLTNHQSIKDIVPFIISGIILFDTLTQN